MQWTVGWQPDCDGPSGDDGWRWWQWAMAGAIMGDSNSGGTIPMAVNDGGAMDGTNG